MKPLLHVVDHIYPKGLLMASNALELDILKSTVFYTSDNQTVHIDKSYDAIGEFITLQKLLKFVRSSRAIVYNLLKVTDGYAIGCNENVGMRIYRFMFNQDVYLLTEFPKHKFSPDIDFFCQEYQRLEISSLLASYRDAQDVFSVVEHIVAVLNEFIASVQRFLQDDKCKLAVSNFERAAIKNYASARSYLASMFQVYSRLMIIRLDLSYKMDAITSLKLQNVIEHRKKFLESFRSDRMLKNAIGYLWKLEYGKNRGYHFHFMLIFDGSKHREDVSIAKYIGELWASAITSGTGVYFNCNARKIKYRDCGIGVISHDADASSMMGLDLALAYLTKPEKYIKLLVGQKNRTFGRGVSPKPKARKVGRPRKHQARADTPNSQVGATF